MYKCIILYTMKMHDNINNYHLTDDIIICTLSYTYIIIYTQP